MRDFVLIIVFLIHSVGILSNQYGGIVFSELMIDPEPAVGLPEAEYVELYNRSDMPVSLNGWTLYYGGKSYPFPDCRIESSGYCVLCSMRDSLRFSPDIPVTVFASFPALANTGGLLYLVSEKGALISCVEYSNKWYGDAFKENGGWSLECIDLENISGQSSNWTVSRDPSGGTPGRMNSVVARNPDNASPSCAGISVISPTEIELYFSKYIDRDLLVSKANYEVSPQSTLISNATAGCPECRSVLLTLSDSLARGEMYELEISGLADVSGLLMADTIVRFGLPEKPASFDLSLNELLFDPVPDGCDYVEFVNRSDKCIDLSQVWVTNRTESGSLNEGARLTDKHIPCMPGSYWLISENSESVCAANGCSKAQNALDIPSFPSMSDASGTIVLLTTSAEIIDEVSYKKSMHFPLISQCEGVSLEKVNPDLSSADPESWRSASSDSGYGTPGFQNSQYMALNYESENGFSVENKWITPDNDGKDDFIVINYNVSESSVANLVIYDLNGRVVKVLVQNQLLGSKGRYLWDGTSDKGSQVPFGRYILQTEYFNPYGKRILKRFVLAVLF